MIHIETPSLLLAYFLTYVLFACVWRSLLVYKRTRTNPFVLSTSDDTYGYVGRAFTGVVVGCALVVALNLSATTRPWLGVYPPLQVTVVTSIGWALLMFSLIWVLIAQAQMGSSWRIGIDAHNRTALVQSGLFALSRNPIFLALRVNVLGFFLVVPSAATVALLVAGELLIQIQVRLEEQHLLLRHGSEYAAYCKKVRRWL